MLKKLLIQLEPSKFESDVVVVDLDKLRIPIMVTGKINEEGLKVIPEDQLSNLIKLDSISKIITLSCLIATEYTIIVEKPYKNENI